MATPPLRADFTDPTPAAPGNLPAAEYNLNATRTDTAFDQAAAAYKPGGTDVAIADGGTGASTAVAARTNLGLGTMATLSPTGTKNTTTFLRGDDTYAVPPAGGGGYTPGGTDVAITDGGTGASTLPAGLLKGAGTSPIVAATPGTDYYAPAGTDVALADGGTGASTAPNARTNLGLGTLSTITPTGTKNATTFLRGDDAYATPPGGGDAATNTTTSVANEAVVFADTAGKLLKRSALNGVIKQTSGVQSVATPGTDYYNPGGTDVPISDGGTGASTAAAARTNLGLGTLATVTPTGTPSGTTFLNGLGAYAVPGGGGGGGSSMPNVIDDFGANPDYPANSASSGNAFRNAAAAGGAVRVPAGSYLFDGASISTNNLILHGDGPGQTTINMSAGVRFWDKTDWFDCLEMAGIRFVDGAGAIRSTYADSTVSGYRIIENCRFERFTQCAIGHRNTDSPYWSIRDCAFGARFATDDELTALPAASAGTIGVALSGLVDTVNIENCDFYCYQIGVKLGLQGANAHIRGGNFLRYSAYATFPRTDIWIPPFPTNPYASGDNAGDGFTVTEVKFGNEGKDNADFCILYADAAAGNFEAALPVYTASTGYIVGHTFDRVVHSCNATGEVPLVHSTTPNVFGCTIGPVFQSGASDIPLLRFLSATGIDPLYFRGNTVGPMLNGLNDQYVQSAVNLVSAVSGTIPYQPQNALGNRINVFRGAGPRTLDPHTKVNTATGATNTFTLPPVAGNKGVEFIFKNEGSGNLTITGATNSIWAAAQVTSYTIATGLGGRIINDGSHWVTF